MRLLSILETTMSNPKIDQEKTITEQVAEMAQSIREERLRNMQKKLENDFNKAAVADKKRARTKNKKAN